MQPHPPADEEKLLLTEACPPTDVEGITELEIPSLQCPATSLVQGGSSVGGQEDGQGQATHTVPG